MTNEQIKRERLPNPDGDFRAERCGHNFHPTDCPYKFCGYRDTLLVLEGLTDSTQVAAANRLKEKQALPDQIKAYQSNPILHAAVHGTYSLVVGLDPHLTRDEKARLVDGLAMIFSGYQETLRMSLESSQAALKDALERQSPVFVVKGD